jgi:NAD(P)H-quinone oxidoreductase subunit 5
MHENWHAVETAWPIAVGLCAPGVLGLAAVTCRPTAAASHCGRRAQFATLAALAVALLGLVAMLAAGPRSTSWLRLDAIGAVVLLLVAFIGWVIARFSRGYLQGEAGEGRYFRWLLATLSGATLVLLANHLLVLAAAWWGTSLALHRLLLFYRQRPAARIAAHKKFLLARAADTCMAIACALLWATTGTLQIDTLVDAAATGALPLPVHGAMLLVATAAILKCAQLPFHGWLIQVMEAPTPVSALLHAGVVNLGGFVLLRLAPIVDQAFAAQVLLVLVGTTTAVVAALVMTTRISIKVSLAWSTCAQMGFMLMQCGLGLWPMALLHLVAHSLYKAHAFLGAGGTVRETLVGRLAEPAPAPHLVEIGVGVAGGLAAVVAAALAWRVDAAAQPALGVLGAILGLAFNPLLAGGPRTWLRGWAVAFALASLYFALHDALEQWLLPSGHVANALWPIPVVGFATLFAVQTAIRLRAASARRLYAPFFGGLFLDERVSRLLFRWSPPPHA